MNIVALIGNVASEPQLRYTPGGRAVCEFKLAISRVGGEQADIFLVVAWERQAEVCHEYLNVGRRVGVTGQLHHTSWAKGDESTTSRIEIVASRVELLGADRSPAVCDSESADTPDEVPA